MQLFYGRHRRKETAVPEGDKGMPALAVDVSTVPEAVVVTAAGDLDVATAPVLRLRVRAALEQRPRAVIADLGGIGFCGSAGLQVLAEVVTATAVRDIPFAVVTQQYPVLRALEITRMDATLALHPTVARARSWIRERNG
jgi:anti-sigma B factor antagonist